MPKMGNILGAGNRIRQLREQLGITQEEFALKLGVRSSTISRYETGRLPKPPVLERIAKIGNTTVDWILKGDTNQFADQMAAAGQPPATDSGHFEYEPPEPARPESPQASRLAPASAEPRLDLRLLHDIVEKVEIVFKETGLDLLPSKKADLIVLLYEEITEEGLAKELNPGKILRFTKALKS